MRIADLAVAGMILVVAVALSGCAPNTSSAPAPPIASPAAVNPVAGKPGPAMDGRVPGGGPGQAAAKTQAQPTPPPGIPVAPAGTLGEKRISPTDGAEMVYVPAAKLQPVSGRAAAELKSFWIDKTEVTNQQYQQFIEAGGYSKAEHWSDEGWKWVQGNHITQPLLWDDPAYNAPQQPVVGVSWWEANAYAKWAEKRLPTEYEWELAARGTDKRLWPWGNQWDKAKANAFDGSAGKSVAVGNYLDAASPYGVLDMAGNAWEWTADWYRWRPFGRNQRTPDDKQLKGSSWDQSFDQEARCDERRGQVQLRYSSGGFRTAQ
jgi:formylglycine-generating enzyme required for sulfatase activity